MESVITEEEMWDEKTEQNRGGGAPPLTRLDAQVRQRTAKDMKFELGVILAKKIKRADSRPTGI